VLAVDLGGGLLTRTPREPEMIFQYSPAAVRNAEALSDSPRPARMAPVPCSTSMPISHYCICADRTSRSRASSSTPPGPYHDKQDLIKATGQD